LLRCDHAIDVADLVLRKAVYPNPAKPSIISAHVEGSGVATAAAKPEMRGCLNCSQPVSGLEKVIEEIVSVPEARIVMKFDPFVPVKESRKVPSFAATPMSRVLPFALFRSTMKSVNV
jgi:alpha-beta hydrolase superfamily lysophospholipase